MSMLAEPRRKVKYGSNPRGEDWARDENKFGQKLMEKMGWSKGKGLGANEDGHTEHIKVQVKNDNRGVGCSKNHADNWIAHQDDFNALLSTLQQSQSEGEQSPARHSNSQVQSLEQKSQTSKSRVHYKKFARGKDLSGKNTEDLDCVFGRRKSAANAAQSEERSEEEVAVRAESSGSDSGSDSSSSTEKSEQESSSEKSEHGVVTINTGLSVQEYFAQKMAALRRGKPPAAASTEPQPQPQPDQTLASAAEPVDEEEPVTKKKKSKKKKKEKEEEKGESGNSESSDDKEKKKQKKNKDVVECETDNKSSKKKCKKSKDERIAEEGKKSKKKKRKTTESDEDIKTKKCNKSIDEKANTNEEEKVSKKKCKKSKDEKAEEEMECRKRKQDDSPEAPPKKQKKRKTDEQKIAKLSEAVNDFKDVNLDQIKGINNGEKLGGFKRR